MTDDNPYRPPDAEPPFAANSSTTEVRAIPLHRAIINAWRDLFASRKSLLMRSYTLSIHTLDPEAPAPATVEEARQRIASLQQAPLASDSARDAMESKLVFGSRIVACWTVFWTTLLPAMVSGFFCVHQIRSIRQPTALNFVSIPIGSIIFFLFCAVLGVAIESALTRPFNAVLGKLLVVAVDSRDERAGDKPEGPTRNRLAPP
jgi:hypothetical protein